MKDLLPELLARRVPQVTGLYLAGSWALVEFLDWAVEQFVLSPHITSFVFLLLLLLLPSVVMLTWRHGTPGRDRWGRIEAVGIPLNLILGATVLFIGFAGKDLGAATTTLVVEDEAGNEIEREVPKQAFRKRVALFSFDNASGDTALDWMSYGIPLAAQMDLTQQLFVTTTTALGQDGMLQDLREAGFDDGVGVPLALKQDVTEKRHIDYFLSGSFVTDATGYTLEYELYETRRAKLLASQSFNGTDLFSLIDRMSEQLRRDLDIPAYRIEESTDLPVTELMTTSIPAFRGMSLGVHVSSKGDVPGAIPFMESAVEADPTFAMAQTELAFSYLLSNRREEANAAIDAAVQHLYRLPERYQLVVRAMKQWLFDQDAEKALNTAKYWGELYPDDVQAHQTLADLYLTRAERGEAIAELEIVLELDPTQYDHLLTIGNLYAVQRQYEQALAYFQRYADQFPDDYRSYTSPASVHRIMGEHDRARAAYERAMVVDPGEASIPLQLAGLETDLGNFDEAAELRDQSLTASKSPQDRFAVYELDESWHYRQGRYREMAEDYQRRVETGAEFLAPVNRVLTVMNSNFLQDAAEAGNSVAALRELDRLSAQLSPPFDGLLAIVYVLVYQSLEDVENTRAQVERLEATIDALGVEDVSFIVDLGLGRIAEMEGDCEEAIASYNKVLEASPTDVEINVWVARCQLTLGDPEAAEASLAELLSIIPAYAHAHHQLALVYEAMGRTDDAIAQLEAALEIWKNADREFIPAQKARARLAELKTTRT